VGGETFSIPSPPKRIGETRKSKVWATTTAKQAKQIESREDYEEEEQTE
jgi:hypothetical protein